MITDKELLKLVKYKLGIFDLSQDISEEDLQNVYELVVNDMSLSGRKKDVDLTQLSCLVNLQRLDLVNFDIDDKFAEAISSLTKLEHLGISLSRIQAPIKCGTIEHISVEDSKVKRYDYLPSAEQLEFISQNVDVNELSKQIESVKDMSFYGGSIKASYKIGDFSELESIAFIDAKLDDKKVLDKLKEKGIRVEHVFEDRDLSTNLRV